MWSNKSYLILLLATFLAFGFTAMVRADDDEGEGCQIAGTYWVKIEAVFGDDVYGLLTLTADGRVILANQNGPYESAGYGNWEKVKARGLKGRSITFGFNADAPFQSVTAELIFEGEFDGKSEEGKFRGKCEEGVLLFEVKLYFPPDQNPFEDSPAPFGNEGTIYARRIPTD